LSEKNTLSIQQFVDSQDAVWPIHTELIGVRTSGQTFPMNIGVSRVVSNNVAMLVVVVRDIADERELEVELLQAQKLESIGRLTAGIGHEINSPMQLISDNVSFISDAFSEVMSLLKAYSTLDFEN
jgi:nitrogen-specific signal transduction histidine kinase